MKIILPYDVYDEQYNYTNQCNQEKYTKNSYNDPYWKYQEILDQCWSILINFALLVPIDRPDKDIHAQNLVSPRFEKCVLKITRVPIALLGKPL